MLGWSERTDNGQVSDSLRRGIEVGWAGKRGAKGYSEPWRPPSPPTATCVEFAATGIAIRLTSCDNCKWLAMGLRRPRPPGPPSRRPLHERRDQRLAVRARAGDLPAPASGPRP